MRAHILNPPRCIAWMAHCVTLMLVLSSLSPALSQAEARRVEFYRNVLSPTGVPAASDDWDIAPFSDAGAWIGFALPPEDRPASYPGFTGPFLMPEGRWLSPQLARLELHDAVRHQALDQGRLNHHTSWSVPGALHATARSATLEVSSVLWFASRRTAVLQVTLHNTGAEARQLRAAWVGGVFADAQLGVDGDGIVALSAASHRVRLATTGTAGAPRVQPAEEATAGATDPDAKVTAVGDRYHWPLRDIHLPAGASRTLAISFTWGLGNEAVDLRAGEAVLQDVEASLEATRVRWDGWVAAVDGGQSGITPSQIIAVKSLMTLVNNWRGASGRMPHDALFPSSNVWYFNGFWAWDTWKHAVGILTFDAELAKENVRAMFVHQDQHGMVADVVYQDAREDNWRDTKPPLAGWAVRRIFEETGDLAFVQEIMPRLTRYHRFWYADRDHDGDGLCEYGSTDGTIVAARWESGMDNAVRFDSTLMVQNNEHAWSMNQESVDLNAYLYDEKRSLAILAQVLGDSESAQRWTREADQLGEQIRTTMWDEQTGWFYDTDMQTGEFVRVQGPEGWTPLWAGVATPEQAARVRETMLDPERFRTPVPLPTVSRADPGFSEGYWRGLVWLDQVYFGIRGLQRYGFEEDAVALRDQLFANLEGASRHGVPLRENYNALNGEGRNVRHFSWSAAHLLLLTRSP